MFEVRVIIVSLSVQTLAQATNLEMRLLWGRSGKQGIRLAKTRQTSSGSAKKESRAAHMEGSRL